MKSKNRYLAALLCVALMCMMLTGCTGTKKDAGEDIAPTPAVVSFRRMPLDDTPPHLRINPAELAANENGDDGRIASSESDKSRDEECVSNAQLPKDKTLVNAAIDGGENP